MNTWSEPPPVAQSYPVHLNDYLAVLKRRKWVVIGFFIVVVAVASVFSFLASPVYKATAQIIIEMPTFPVANPGQALTNPFAQADYYETQLFLLQNRELARQVIAGLQLRAEIETGQPDSPVLTSAPAHAGLPNPPDAVTETVAPEAIDEAAINWYLANLTITPVRSTRLVDISFSAPSPVKAARIADAHVEAFIAANIRNQHEDSEQRFNWLEQQLEKQKAKVEASQRTLYDYKKANAIGSPEERQDIVSQQLMEINSVLTKAQAESQAQQTAWSQLRPAAKVEERLLAVPEIAQDAAIQEMRSQHSSLKSQLAELASTYGPKHPKMIEIGSRLQQLEEEIWKEVARVRQSVQERLTRAQAYETALQGSLDGHKKAALAQQEKAIDYDVLRREAESNQNMYDLLLQQAKEISLLSAFESNSIRIVRNADVPLFPAKPKVLLNVLIAAGIGLLLGTGLAFFIDYMDDTIKNPEDVQRQLAMPVLGAIPHEESLHRLPVPALPFFSDAGGNDQGAALYPAYSDIAGRLPVEIYYSRPGMSGQVLLVESAAMSEGKTTVVGMLATSLGRAGLRVLAADGNVLHPALHHFFGLENETGLTTAMAKVFTAQIGAGNLTDCTVSDLFALLRLQKLGGRLTVTNKDQAMIAVFGSGRLLHIEYTETPAANRMGAMLLRGGLLTEGQLAEAVDRNRRTGQPLGYILVNAGYISRTKLQGTLKLQMEEHLQKLFSWKQGEFRFTSAAVSGPENEKIFFDEDYAAVIERLSKTGGGCFLEQKILSEVRATAEKNVYVLPAGAGHRSPRPMVNYAVLADFLEVLKQRFDVILLDAPPLLEKTAAHTTPLVPLVDGVIYVVKAGYLPIKVLQQAKSRLAEANANIIGAVLNQVQEKWVS